MIDVNYFTFFEFSIIDPSYSSSPSVLPLLPPPYTASELCVTSNSPTTCGYIHLLFPFLNNSRIKLFTINSSHPHGLTTVASGITFTQLPLIPIKALQSKLPHHRGRASPPTHPPTHTHTQMKENLNQCTCMYKDIRLILQRTIHCTLQYL